MRDGSWTGSIRNSVGRHPLGLPACCETPRPNRRRVYVLDPSLARAGYGIILLGSCRDYPIGSFTTAVSRVGLSYRFRFDRRTEYGTIQLVPRRNRSEPASGIPRQASTRPTSMGLSYRFRGSPCLPPVWDYPIGFAGTILSIPVPVASWCGTILSGSPGLSN